MPATKEVRGGPRWLLPPYHYQRDGWDGLIDGLQMTATGFNVTQNLVM